MAASRRHCSSSRPAPVAVWMHLATYAAATPKTAISVNKKALLNPPRKYFGVFVPGAPDNISAVTDPTAEHHHQRNR